MEQSISYFLRGLTDFAFRRRSPALAIAKIGLGCLILGIGATFYFDAEIPLQEGTLHLNFDSSGGTPAIVIYGIVGLGTAAVIGGTLVEGIRLLAEHRRSAKRRVLVVETRGLRFSAGKALAESLPSSISGQRESILIDFRQGITEGKIVDAQAAADRLISLPQEIQNRSGGMDRGDFSIVYGGLSPVPLTFLTGVQIDDEDSVTVSDWDRHASSWRMLNDIDDGKRFTIDSLSSVPQSAPDVALAISVSYRVNIEGIRKKIGSMPLISMTIADGGADCHWSETKQMALGKQFLETMIELGNLGVKTVHIFLAAQNSVVFRFGRLYDKRNLPGVVVYQYQQESDPPYPWGLMMPVAGTPRARVLS